MVAREQLGDRPAHRVAGHEHVAQVERAEQPGDVVGAVLQAEGLRRADPATVAPVIDGQDPVAGLGQRRVDPDPVEVGRGGPAVQEQQRRAVAAGVAQEDLPAVRDRTVRPGGSGAGGIGAVREGTWRAMPRC